MKAVEAADMTDAEKLAADLRPHFPVFYDESGAIGRRYRRQDEVGTPFCLTIDGQTIQDQTVTVRDRDTLVQERVAADRLREFISSRIA
jgi:glycyl-tRNA synthetase